MRTKTKIIVLVTITLGLGFIFIVYKNLPVSTLEGVYRSIAPEELQNMFKPNPKALEMASMQR